MHPQDIRAGQGAVQLMQNALQNQAQAQDKATQAFDRLSENAFNFAKYFENKQRYQEEKAFREQAYNDEKAYKEQRDKISDERYTKEFDENKRRYDNDYAIKKEVAKAQTNLYGKQATGLHYGNQLARTDIAAHIAAKSENTPKDTVGQKTAQGIYTSSMGNLGNNKVLKDTQEWYKKAELNPNLVDLNTKLPNATNSNTPLLQNHMARQ